MEYGDGDFYDEFEVFDDEDEDDMDEDEEYELTRDQAMEISDEFLSEYNHDYWDGSGEMPDSVNTEDVYETAPGEAFGCEDFLDLWIEHTGTGYAVVVEKDGGISHEETEEIDSVEAVAEAVMSAFYNEDTELAI